MPQHGLSIKGLAIEAIQKKMKLTRTADVLGVAALSRATALSAIEPATTSAAETGPRGALAVSSARKRLGQLREHQEQTNH